MDKQQILETITTVSKLISLSFKPVGTKISIRDHKLILCDTNKTDTYFTIPFSQQIDRIFNKDSREDIYVLNHVIVNFIQWYLIPYKSNNSPIYKDLLEMTKYLCVGLKRLQLTYKKGNVVGTLQYYINVLTAVIEDKFCSTMLYIYEDDSPQDTIEKGESKDNEEDENELEYSTFLDIEKIKNFWSDKEIHQIFEQFNKCFRNTQQLLKKKILKTQNLKKENLVVTSKDDIPQRKNSNNTADFFECDDDEITENIFENQSIKSDDLNTSFETDLQLDEFDKRFPIPKNQNNALVAGYLVGIDKILTAMDTKFSNMLNKSVKGTK